MGGCRNPALRGTSIRASSAICPMRTIRCDDPLSTSRGVVLHPPTSTSDLHAWRQIALALGWRQHRLNRHTSPTEFLVSSQLSRLWLRSDRLAPSPSPSAGSASERLSHSAVAGPHPETA